MSEKTDLLQGYILRQIHESGSSDLNRYDIFLNPQTLRLRNRGCNEMSKIYTSYRFKLEEKVTSGHLLKLFEKMEYPYYYGRKRFVLFSEQDAFWFKLAGYDAWIEGK